MIFSSMTFLWIFFPILLAVYFIVGKKLKNIVLLFFSLIFYSWGEPKYILLMLFSIFINYIFGRIIDFAKDKKIKKIVFILSIIFNISLIGYFKYFNFFLENIYYLFNFNYDINLIKDIALPIGISFYTFQIISYQIDLYKKKIKVQKNILDLALYISFFPQLIAGPIVKYHDIENQLKNRKITIEKFASGIKRFVYGLSKKVILADYLAFIADYIFDTDISLINMQVAWIGAICYMLQIYFDFSGYSDMAIGLGKMFGFDFIENFNLPYISKSITEFWRRWHISLSTWFKEYVYIPLGGNRKGKLRTYLNLTIVFLLTGLWHGAEWNFVIWGLYHGIFLIIEKIKLKEILDNNKFKIINYIYTLLVVLVGWVLFRTHGIKNAFEYLRIMFIPSNISTYLDLSQIANIRNVIIIIIAILFSGILQNIFNEFKNKEKIKCFYQKYLEIIIIPILLFVSIMILASNSYSTFIYFRF